MQGFKRAMPNGIVAQAYYVVVGESGAFNILIEIAGGCWHRCAFAVQHYFGFWTHLAHRLCAVGEKGGKALPGSAVIVVALSRIAAVAGAVHVHSKPAVGAIVPQHAVAHLVAHLHKVGGGTGCHQRLKRFFGVGIHLVGNGGCGCACTHAPAGGHCLLAHISPGVAVVNVEQKIHAFVLDTFAQCRNIVDVLARSGVVVVARLYEQAHTNGIPAAGVFHKRHHVVDDCAIGIEPLVAHLFISRHKREVAASYTHSIGAHCCHHAQATHQCHHNE